MTTEEFELIVKDWMKTARHPRFNRPYTELIYRPMLELMDYLRACAFKVYIVSGGGVEFIRPWAPAVCGASLWGRLDHALTEALARGWTIIDMRDSWKRLYAFKC